MNDFQYHHIKLYTLSKVINYNLNIFLLFIFRGGEVGDNKILSQNKIKIFDLFKINYFNILFFIYNKMFRKNFKTNYFIFINFMYI